MLNFNVEPYRDDFDPNKHFHRILFKPGRAVQARELTQSQTILQDQISKFAFHIFSQNTPVSGGNVTINQDCYYIKLLPEFEEVPIDVNNFLNRVVRDDNGTVLARVIAVAEEVFVNEVSVEPPTLIVSYISGQTFDAGDTIYSADDFNFTAKISSVSDYTGKSSAAHIAEGVFFVVNGYSYSNVQNPDGTYSKYTIGNFVGVQPQTIVLSKYNNKPTLRIGLNITETVHDYIDNVSLLDPAIGASNYQAPGADRYVILLSLETRTLGLGDDQSFIELVRLEEGEIKRQVNSTVYSVIDDYFAKRTSETNGNFIVNDFVFTPKQNNGDLSGNTYIMSVGKGVAYVNGYRVENQSDLGVLSNRARTVANTNNATVYFEYGNYLYVDNLQGFFNVKTLPKVDIHCVPHGSVGTGTVAYNSTLVASAYIRNIENYVSDINTPASSVYKVYLTDIQTKTITGAATGGSLNNIQISTSNISSVENAYVGCTISITNGSSSGDTRTITASNSAGWITVDRAFSEPTASGSVYAIKFGIKDAESVVLSTTPYSTSTRANINAQFGKDRGFSTGYAKLVEPTEPEMIWPLGYSYVKNLTDTSYEGTYVYENKPLQYANSKLELYLTSPSSTSFFGDNDLSPDEISKNFIISRSANGQILTFNNTTRKIVIEPTNKQSAKIEISDLGSTGFDLNVVSKLSVNNGNGSSILRAKELFEGNTSIYTIGTAVTGKPNVYFNSQLGQVYIKNSDLVPITQIQSLYVCDVKKIVKIYETTSAATNPPANLTTLTGLKDVTKYYSFNNGQKDSYYDHAYIQLNFGAPVRKGNLLVIFDYYEHSADIGYFSVMSYFKGVRNDTYEEILNSSYTSTNGDIYKASDVIDFRPSRKNGDSGFTFDKDYIVPNYLTAFSGDYDYYLGRKDILILSKDRTFEIVEGVPSVYPKFPAIPDGSMDLAKITLDPYTAYITGENGKLTNLFVQKVIHKTWKMKNISDLEQRVNNIEYYTSLSLLEKNAQALQIPDENGLNRFKYGIMADDFSGFSFSDTANFDFNAAILKNEKSLTAAHSVENYPLYCSVLSRNMGKLDSQLLSQFAVTSDKIHKFFTLPFVKTRIIEQKLASRTINVNPVAVLDMVGDLTLSPPMDTFVDNLKLPSLLVADPSFKFYEPSDQANLLNQSDWKLITGTEKEKMIDTSRVIDTAGGTTITNTFEKTWQESRENLYGYYKDLQTNFIETNDFITDINVMPFIRAQEIEFNTKGLLVNTPLNCYFDNVNINEFIRLPNLLMVSSTSAVQFKEGDIIGYKDTGGVFRTTGKVLGVSYPRGSYVTMIYPPTSPLVVYLYVVGDLGKTQYGDGNSSIMNAVFDPNGNYIRSTATGTIINTLHASGLCTPSGGTVSPYDYYENETGRDYNMITKAESLGKNNNVYIPKTLYKKTITLATTNQIKLSALASSSDNFYNDAIITIFNPREVGGNWSVSAIITDYEVNGSDKIVTLDRTITFESSNATVYSICRNTSIYRTSVSTSLGTSKNNPVNFDEPLPMMSSTSGDFCGIFRLPGGTFYSGTKVFRVDNGIDGNANSATTYAESVFFASNLATQSQSLQFASQIPGWTETDKQNKSSIRKESRYIPPPPPPPPPREPLAQTFLIEGNLYPNGAFLKSLNLFFRTRGVDDVVYIYLVETLNGYPTTKVLENSKVVAQPALVNTSERPHYLDTTTSTTFEFPVPVYIKPETLYAFVVKTSSIDYTCWLAAQNDFALPSTAKNLPTDPDPEVTSKLSANPYVGTVFVSQNAITWSAEQTKSLMFTIEACQFDTSKTPNIDFIVPKYMPRCKPIDFAIAHYDEDTAIIQDTSYNISSYRNTIEYDKFNVSTSDFTPTQTSVNYTYDTTPNSTFLLTENKIPVKPGRYGTPSADQYLNDGKGVRVIAANTNQSFMLTAQLKSSDKWVSPVLSDDGISLFTVKHLINELGVYSYNVNIIDGGKNFSNANTGVIIESTGYGFGAEADVEVDPTDGSIEKVVFRNNGQNYATRPKILLNTIQTANTVSASNVMIFKTGTGGYIANGYVYVGQTVANSTGATTTVVSANNANGYVIVANSIYGTHNNQTYYVSGEPIREDGSRAIVVNCETCTGKGNGLAKYISKKVVLAPGNEAGDLRVYYTAYRPLNTNIYVYYKLLSSEDNQKFEDGSWQIMTVITGGSRFSSNRNDLIEYVAAPGINNIANNNISYASIDGTTYTSFNQFAIKVVLMTTDPTYVPFLADIRAIALPSGTGMI